MSTLSFELNEFSDLENLLENELANEKDDENSDGNNIIIQSTIIILVMIIIIYRTLTIITERFIQMSIAMKTEIILRDSITRRTISNQEP